MTCFICSDFSVLDLVQQFSKFPSLFVTDFANRKYRLSWEAGQLQSPISMFSLTSKNKNIITNKSTMIFYFLSLVQTFAVDLYLTSHL